jgi:biopolymer transport protein ExbD
MSFGGFNQGNSGQPMAEINMVPLIDVMLVLLVIFIITAPLFQQAVPIDLPQVASTQIEPPAQTIQLALDASGALFLDGAATSRAAVEAHFAALTARQPELHLRADRATRYEQVADILAAAQRAGINKIAFVTETPAP